MTLFLLSLLTATPAGAQEWLCDSSHQDCRAPLLNLIQAERTGIDAAFSLMTDSRYAEAIIARWAAGVPVRVLVDARVGADRAHAAILARLIAAGVPMRARAEGGPLQWTLMLFTGQRVVQFGGADYSARAFVPVQPYVDHEGSVIYFSDDPAIVHSIMTKYDDEWTSSATRAVRGRGAETPVRRHPSFALAPELTFSAGAAE